MILRLEQAGRLLLQMTLEAGSRLGGYEITGPLGAGGMGEVYRARDTRLGREVAIKVLPEALAKDSERLERFEREAKALAALNHPHVATLYGMERHDGVPFLSMELVEGPTVADRITQGPMSPDEARVVFGQIAEGLEAAHERGIVHRDLKPANIKLGSDESGDVARAKILDFGLAKALDAPGASGDADLSDSPTMTLGATAHGAILGTAAYMAPEQARGRAVDKRADIWAFGVCLWEALTGRRLFAGDDAPTTLAAVLRDEPDMADLGAVPASLRRLLARCLEKDPRQRLRDIGEARVTLTAGHASDAASSETGEGVSEGEAADSRRPRWLTTATTAIACLGIGALLGPWVFTERSPSPVNDRPPLTFSIKMPSEGAGTLGGITLSPDGRTLFVSATSDDVQGSNRFFSLYRRDLGSLGTVSVPEADRAFQPFFAPDGRSVGFFAGGKVQHLSLDSGQISTVTEYSGFRTTGGAWGEGDTILYGLSGESAVYRVSAAGGEPVRLPFAVEGGSRVGVSQLLEGHGIALLDLGFVSSQTQVAALSLESGELTLLAPGRRPAYVPLSSASDGALVYQRDDTLRARRFNPSTLSISNEEVLVHRGVEPLLSFGQSFAISGSGDLAFQRGTSSARELVWVGPDGVVEPLGFEAERVSEPRLSPDESRLVLIHDESQELWIYDLARSITQLLVEGPVNHPVWSPDGEWVAYSANLGGSGQGVFRVRSDGRGTPERLTSGPHRPETWSPEGDRIVFLDSTDGWDLGVIEGLNQDDAGKPSMRSLLASAATEVQPSISPDGRWIAVATSEPGPLAVFVWPFPQVEGRGTRISAGFGDDPVWSKDGNALYFLSGSNIQKVVVALDQPPSSWGKEETYINFNGSRRASRNFDVARDGRFVMLRGIGGEDFSSEGEIAYVQGWTRELERLLSP